MKKYTNRENLIELSEQLLDAFCEGYDLLALAKKAYPDFKIPRSVLSTIRVDRSSVEAVDWLCDLMSYLLHSASKEIGQEYVNSYYKLVDCIDRLDEERAKLLKCYLFDILSNSLYFDEDYKRFDDLPEEEVNDYLSQVPLRFSTVASKLFDACPDFIYRIESYVAFFLQNLLEIQCDAYEMTFINDNAYNAIHPTSDFESSVTIISYASTSQTWYNFSDSFDCSNEFEFLDALKAAYLALIKSS